MKQTNEPKLDIYQFGRELLKIKDLDPVYVILHHHQWPSSDQLMDWLVAYWCFYHVGTASWIAQSADGYWKRMEQAAGSKEWPRSSERRHFRGQQALNSVAYLKSRGVDKLFEDLMKAGPTAADVTEAVQKWKGFGPWISFKVADMLERLGMRAVEFDMDTVMYSSPQEAAELLWRVEHPGQGRRAEDKGEGAWAIDQVLYELGPIKAPPGYERLLNAQEVETILCKWKSYMNGHYHVGEDVTAVRNGLLRFAKCGLAQKLLKAGTKGGLWPC